MAYYNMQGPAQYQQHQQSRKDQQMSQMLQMMMQMRALKQRGGQFEQGQALQQEKFKLGQQQLESIDKYRQAQIKEWGKPPKQQRPSAEIQSAMLVSKETNEPVGSILKRWRSPALKPPTQYDVKKKDLGILLANKEIKFPQYLKGLYSIESEEQGEDDKLSVPALNSNRRLIKNAVTSRIAAIRKDTSWNDRKRAAQYLNTDGLFLDMPNKYNYIRAFQEQDPQLVTMEDQAYLTMAEEQREWLESHPEIKKLKHINAGILAEWSIEQRQVAGAYLKVKH